MHVFVRSHVDKIDIRQHIYLSIYLSIYLASKQVSYIDSKYANN